MDYIIAFCRKDRASPWKFDAYPPFFSSASKKIQRMLFLANAYNMRSPKKLRISSNIFDILDREKKFCHFAIPKNISETERCLERKRIKKKEQEMLIN